MSRNDDIRRQVRRAVEEALAEQAGGAASGPGPRSAQEPRGSSRQAGEAIALGADHGGYRLKEALAGFLRERGWRVEDCGTHGTEAVDYPDFAHAVAERVATGACRWGIVVDGAGIGSAMVANKVPGVRAALCYDLSSARNSREHNHANVLTLGAGLIGEALARQIVAEWLATPWGPDRHARRVEKIDAVERRYLRIE
jgi:ribose 5-phosphate isomerase B